MSGGIEIPLFPLNAVLFPGGSLIRRLTVGEYRDEAADPMQIVSGPIGRETVQYVSNIYKYYVAYTLILEQQRAREAAKKRDR